MANDNVELLRGAYDAFGRGDIPAVMSIFAEDIEWRAAPNVLPQGIEARGTEEVGQFFQGLGETWEDFSVDVSDYCASGDRVCVIGTATGKLDGEETGYRFVHAWTVRDGACTRFDEYVDPEPAVVAA